MLSFLGAQGKQIFIGNILIVGCCVFYLAWWLLAFKPTGAITGMRTGWLLIPACVFGLIGVLTALRGIRTFAPAQQLFPGGVALWGGVAAYIVLLIVTVLLLHRPVTTELFLIVGWAVLALSEMNALFGSGLFSHKLSVGFVITILAASAVSLVCYIIYYQLDSKASFITGMVPLLMTALVTIAISCALLISNRQ
jgi:hypothetical protein